MKNRAKLTLDTRSSTPLPCACMQGRCTAPSPHYFRLAHDRSVVKAAPGPGHSGGHARARQCEGEVCLCRQKRQTSNPWPGDYKVVRTSCELVGGTCLAPFFTGSPNLSVPCQSDVIRVVWSLPKLVQPCAGGAQLQQKWHSRQRGPGSRAQVTRGCFPPIFIMGGRMAKVPCPTACSQGP